MGEMASMKEENLRLREALSEGLDLCARARRMDEMERERAELYLRNPDMTRSATIPLWAEEQYQKDLAAWEAKAKSLMSFPFIALSAREQSK